MSLEFRREEQGSLNWFPVTGIQMVARRKLGTGLFNPLRSLLRKQTCVVKKKPVGRARSKVLKLLVRSHKAQGTSLVIFPFLKRYLK